MKPLFPTSGARRELRYALRALRASITHLRHSESVNFLPVKSRSAVERTRRDAHELEEEICRRLGELR